MSVIVLRIDDRLIHGQVVESWLNATRTEVVLVVNDIVAQDEMQKVLMAMAVPSEIDVYIESVEGALAKFKEGLFDKKRTFVLVATPKDAHTLMEHGITPPAINVGGMHYAEGKHQIFEYISVDDEDVHYFFALECKGIHIEGKTIPNAERFDLMKALHKECKL